MSKIHVSNNDQQENIKIHIIAIEDDEIDVGKDPVTQLREKMVEFEKFKREKDRIEMIQFQRNHHEPILQLKPIIKSGRPVMAKSPPAGPRGLKETTNDDAFDFISINTQKPPTKLTSK